MICLHILIFLDLAWSLTLNLNRWLTVLVQSVLFIYLEKLPSLLQFQTQMVHAVLITIPSNRQTPSTRSVFIIPDSDINFHLWLFHWVQVWCLATGVSCSSSWPMRPRVWGFNRSMSPDLFEWASTMLWRVTKSNFIPFNFLYIYDNLQSKGLSWNPQGFWLFRKYRKQ